ncbi:MAG: fibrobacter succinogenes major paralogous domain-containing protein [Fibrobacter sp.]|nr:fibrobacter succinogenes major paralogous domain-containing protein [Fibrobacter sp.]
MKSLKIVLCLLLLLLCQSEAAKKTSTHAHKLKKSEVTDARDKQKYRTVKISGREWLADNLNFKTDESFCYAEDDNNCMAYGRLYSWNAASKACPAGFRLPTDEDFESLWTAAGADFNAAYLLKTDYGWSGETNGNDTLKFSAMPAGNRFDDGNYGNLSKMAFFWSASEDGEDANVWYMTSKSMGFAYTTKPKAFGFSVRCVK